MGNLRHRLHSALLSGLATALALACSSLDSPLESERLQPRFTHQEVADGSPASDDDFVFFVEIALGSGTALCTASALSPHLLLTAGHCLTGQFQAVDCETTIVGPPLAPSEFRVTNAPDLSGTPDPTWRFQKPSAVSVLHKGQPLCGNDLGLLVFEEPLSGVARFPTVLPPLSSHESYRALGYGAGHPSGTGERVRRTSQELRVVCREAECDDEVHAGIAGASSAPVPSLSAGEFFGTGAGCPGDSGGPAATTKHDVLGVFAVLSRGTEDCSINIYSDANTPSLRARVRALSAGLGVASLAWAEEVEAPDATPDPPVGGSAGSSSMQGGSAGAFPDEEDERIRTKRDENCSCRAVGTTDSSSSHLLLFFFSLLLLTARWRWTRRRS